MSTDAPYYKKGYAICVSFICLSVVSCIAYAVAVVYENKKKARQPQDTALTEEEKMDLGVSLPCRLVDWLNGALTVWNIGSEPGVQVYAVRKWILHLMRDDLCCFMANIFTNTASDKPAMLSGD